MFSALLFYRELLFDLLERLEEGQVEALAEVMAAALAVG